MPIFLIWYSDDYSIKLFKLVNNSFIKINFILFINNNMCHMSHMRGATTKGQTLNYYELYIEKNKIEAEDRSI